AGAGDLGDHLAQEALLAGDAAEVAVDVASTHERQRLRAVEVHAAGVDVQPGPGVAQRLLDVEGHPADRVDGVDEAGEVHLHVVVDGDAGELLDRVHQALRAAAV